jgi:Salmonella virulence plasmid 65kDa B protein
MGRRKLLWNVRLLKFRKFFAVALTISFTLAPISTARSRGRYRHCINRPVSNQRSSGAYVYKFPIETPPGRNGIEPSLALQYNNLASDNRGSFGYGWSVNVPYIARENKLGTERMLATTSSYFFSSLSGELATTSSSTVFVSRVDDGSFFQYTFSNNKWVVVDKNGVRYTFGTSTLSRQDDPADATRIYKWMLEEIRDTNNNYIKYQYYKDGGQIYPSSIVW